MRKILLIFAAVVLFCSLNSANAYTNVAFSIGFHDTLSPYGTWFHVASYGDVWRPHVRAGWRPFTYGHWEYTSYGPYWEGYEPYAWCVYHYGHWVWVPGYGWSWVPGYEYSYAPVSWAYGDGYIGWSPIIGYSGYNSNFWIVISASRFGYSNYYGYALPTYRIGRIFRDRAVRVVRRPLEIREVERIVRRPVRVVSVRERTVTVDGRRTRLVVPRDSERTVINHVTEAHARHERAVRAKTVKKETPGRSRVIEKSAHRTETIHGNSGRAKMTERKSTATIREKGQNTKRMIASEKSRAGSAVHHTYERSKGATKQAIDSAKTTTHQTYARAKEKAHQTYTKVEHKTVSKNTGGAGSKGSVHTTKQSTHQTTKAKPKTTHKKKH